MLVIESTTLAQTLTRARGAASPSVGGTRLRRRGVCPALADHLATVGREKPYLARPTTPPPRTAERWAASPRGHRQHRACLFSDVLFCIGMKRTPPAGPLRAGLVKESL